MKAEAQARCRGVPVMCVRASNRACVAGMQAKKDAEAKAEQERVEAMDEEERAAYVMCGLLAAIRAADTGCGWWCCCRYDERKRKEALMEERKKKILNRQLKAFGGAKGAKGRALGKGKGRGRRSMVSNRSRRK